MFTNEIEYCEIAFAVADHAGVILQLQQADIAMMKLKRFDLQFGAVLRREAKAGIAAFIRGEMLVKFRLVVIEQGVMAKRTFAVRPAFGIHLQHAEIDAQLYFFLTVFPLKFPNDNLSRFVGPMIEERRNIKVHGANMNAK